MRKIFLFNLVYLCLFLSFFLVTSVAIASTINGTIDNTYKYAWSENSGWVNFGCQNCGVNIASVPNSTNINLTGYAWTQNHGWINFNPVHGGVKIDSNGNMSGHAWGEYAGWIDFSGVLVDSNGQFQGETQPNDIIGKINFNFSNDCPGCRVETDWRPTKPITIPFTSRGGKYISPIPPIGGFSISIDKGEKITSSQTVMLSLNAGNGIKTMAISNTQNFTNSTREPYQSQKQWKLSAGGGVKTVYAIFYDQYGHRSQMLAATITFTTISKNMCDGVIFTRNLKIGSVGKDVKCLQSILNESPVTQITTAGVGSPGMETTLFGNATKQAVIKFQEKNAANILTPQKKIKGNGIVGPATIKELNSLLKK